MSTKASRKRAMKVKCPRCRAEPGSPCRARNHYGSWSGVRPHKQRELRADR